MGGKRKAASAGVTGVRAMREEDLPAVLAIAAETPTAPHWPEFEFRRLLTVCRDEPKRRAAWVALDSRGEIVGFAIASRIGDTAELEAVAAAPRYRRQGAGSALVRAVAAWAGTGRLMLEVRASNDPALRLYDRLGFTRDGVRPRYYRNPDEDAILLSFILKPEGQKGNGDQSTIPETP